MIKTKTSCKECSNLNCLIKKSCLDTDFVEVEQNKVAYKIRKKQPVFEQENESNKIYFIHFGLIKIFKQGAFNKDQIVKFSIDGDILGHRGLIPQNVYPVSGLAITETQICSFSKEYFFQLMMKIPQLSINLSLIFSNELCHEETKLRDMSIFNVREKVAKGLLLLITKFGMNDKNEINNSEFLSRQDIAEFVGLTSNQVTKVLSELKTDKLIETKGKKIKILSKESLQEIVSYLT
ncbi:MAG: Crp/Fnr family transcriptional regulator [Vicingaceae bacterium]